MTSFLLQRRLRHLTFCLGMSGCMAVAGCVVSGRSASVDSISRMPWFNLELKPRKPKNDEPAFRSVRSENRTETRVEPLGLFRGNTGAAAKVESANSVRPSRMLLPITEQNLVVESNSEPGLSNLDFH